MNKDYKNFFKKLDFAILTPYNDEIKRGQRCRVQSLPFSFLSQELHNQLYEAMGLLTERPEALFTFPAKK